MHYLPPGHERDAADDRDELAALASRSGIEASSIERQRFLRRVTVAHAAAGSHGGLAGRPGVMATAIPNVSLAGDWVGPEGMLSDVGVQRALGRRLGARLLTSVPAP